MSTDYIYFGVASCSPAEKAILDFFASRKAQRVFAEKMGETFLPGAKFGLVSNDTHFLGFAPDGCSWKEFDKFVDYKIWRRNEDCSTEWIQPRAKVKGIQKWAVMRTEWSKCPVAISHMQVCAQLFGMDCFMLGLCRSFVRIYCDFDKGTYVVGAPWLAQEGKMQGWSVDTGFKPCDGLVKMHYETALAFVHREELKPKTPEPKKPGEENLFGE
ncbi:MAG: hypothetical protein WC869_01155 [Phycisphaerae bacterium]